MNKYNCLSLDFFRICFLGNETIVINYPSSDPTFPLYYLGMDLSMFWL